MTINPMLIVLCAISIIIAYSIWRAHKRVDVVFDFFDLIMVNGKVDKIAVAFMLVLGVSTWVIIDQQIKGALTEGQFGLWLGAWVSPLVAKVVFGKNEIAASTTSTTVVQQVTETVEPKQ